ncbi:MAG: 30S ribosomal protein S4e [Candidatus Bathyarchaeia archaeon]
MGKKGGKKHLKRKPAPKFWPIHRKEFVWTFKPKPGPHSTSSCVPLALVIRDVLGFAKTRREAKAIVSQEKIMVDGKVQRDELFPAGLMDVVSIPDAEKTYRILPSGKGLTLHPIEKEEAGFKLCRIESKTVVDGGNIQLNLHDGRNVLIQVKDPKKPEEDVYHPMDTLKISVPDQEIIEHTRLAEGTLAIIIGGKNAGRHGKIVATEERPGQKRRNQLVTIEDANGKRFQTTLDLVFVVGDTEPYISLPEVT